VGPTASGVLDPAPRGLSSVLVTTHRMLYAVKLHGRDAGRED
jgi:hypothetical protein